jgi:predicted nucleic acid-binding protein
MTYLVDVSTLLALLWRDYEHHRRVVAWVRDESVAICPIVELGFLRVSTQPIFGASVGEARQMLADWIERTEPKVVPCDAGALDGIAPPTGGRTTDYYLANLAERNGLKWATLDERCSHPAAFLIPR